MPNTGPLPHGSGLRPIKDGPPRCDVFVVCPRAGVRQDAAPFDDGVLCSPVPRLLILTVHQSGADAIRVGAVVVVPTAIGVHVLRVRRTVAGVAIGATEPPVRRGKNTGRTLTQGGCLRRVSKFCLAEPFFRRCTGLSRFSPRQPTGRIPPPASRLPASSPSPRRFSSTTRTYTSRPAPSLSIPCFSQVR